MRPDATNTFPLSAMQQGMLFHQLSGRHPGADFEQIRISLREALDAAAFDRAWQSVAARHAMLRARIAWEGVEEPLACVEPSAAIPVEVADWRGLAPDERERRLAEFLASDRQRGFDLRSAPLSRVALFRCEDDAWEAVWSFPHVALDGRSFPIVLGDLFAFYDAHRRGEALALPPPPSVSDHVAWLATRDRAAAERFWRERLAGFAAPTPLPQGAAAPSGSERVERERRLSREATAALEALAREHGLSLATLVQGALALVLSRYAGERDVAFGATRACRRNGPPGADAMVGLLINTLPVRVALDPERPALAWLQELRARERAVAEHEHAPLVDVQGWSELPPGTPLFHALLVYDNASLDAEMRARGGAFASRGFRLLERTTYPVALYAYGEPELLLRLAVDAPPYDAAFAERMLGHLERTLAAFASAPGERLGALSILAPDEERALLTRWNATRAPVAEDACIHRLFEAQASATPDAVAFRARGAALSYRELDRRANRLARRLRALGVGPEVRVGVCLGRSIELPVALLAVLKAGGAYVPLDPAYPAERLAYVAGDAELAALVTESALAGRLPRHGAHVVQVDFEAEEIAREASERCDGGAGPANLAYLIYTSGSTGRPKGVMVEHRNVVNFFTGMDAHLRGRGVWLAVTSLSFDISVLELLWTLARGFEVVLHEDERRAAEPSRPAGPAGRPLALSLLYFASAETGGSDKYRLLLEGARFADAHGFEAVWMPERHFHEFGGLYPNPAVAAAAVAATTSRIAIRAGSVVLPLHHPARIAEEWALVDNLSGGRVGISIAAGWQPNDFVLRPEGYANARERMYEDVETVRRLWRGEAVEFPGPDGRPVPTRTLPRPLQPELPIWVTAAGSPETFRRAGELGANVLTHLLGQTLEEVGEKIELYRKARAERGLDPDAGRVTLMLHSFVGDDEAAVREAVREPMRAYLRSSVGLIKSFAGAWTAFKKRSDGATEVDVDVASLSPEELDGLLDYSFERYYETSALFGTPESCLAMLDRVAALGVDEVACLIDFGVDVERTLAHLHDLARLRELRCRRDSGGAGDDSLAALIRRHRVTHLQCTPSLAGMLVSEPETRAALGSLEALLVGGEALPPALARELVATGCRELLNVYGPTETTIWSSLHRVQREDGPVPIGRPLANQQLYVLDAERRPVPLGVPGELYIGGRGVVRGYWKRPELTAERFVPDPFGDEPGARLYRTGDLVRRRDDGALEFLGRSDQQVKLRGHRVELGEIEASVARHPDVAETVALVREDEPGDARLVAYATARPGATLDEVQLRAFLRESLPEFMVPSHIVALERFPRTPNGKLDRKALPPPGDAAAQARAPRAPAANEVEERIAEIWREVLRVAEVSREDNFFDLGGHSLLAVKAHRRLSEAFERKLAITDLFRFPTIRALAEHLADASDGPSLTGSSERGEQRRAALAQRRGRLAARRQGGADETEPA